MKRRLRTSGDAFAELTQKDGFFDRLEGETGITLNELFPRNIKAAPEIADNNGNAEEDKEAFYNNGGVVADVARD